MELPEKTSPEQGGDETTANNNPRDETQENRQAGTADRKANIIDAAEGLSGLVIGVFGFALSESGFHCCALICYLVALWLAFIVLEHRTKEMPFAGRELLYRMVMLSTGLLFIFLLWHTYRLEYPPITKPDKWQPAEQQAPFTIKIEEAVVAPNRGAGGGSWLAPFWLLYDVPQAPKLSPIFGALYILFNNTTEAPYMISSLDIEAKTASNRWESVPLISPNEGVLVVPSPMMRLKPRSFYGGGDLAHARIVNLGENDFHANIEHADIAPHRTVQGWVFFQIPKDGFGRMIRFHMSAIGAEGTQTIPIVIVNDAMLGTSPTDSTNLLSLGSNTISVTITPVSDSDGFIQRANFTLEPGETNLTAIPIEVIEDSIK